MTTYRDGMRVGASCCPTCGRAGAGAILSIPSGRGARHVALADVTHVLSSDKCVDIWTAAGRAGTLSMTVAKLLRRYPGEFVPAANGAAVRLSAVRSSRTRISPGGNQCGAVLTLDGGHEVVSSRREWPRLKSLL